MTKLKENGSSYKSSLPSLASTDGVPFGLYELVKKYMKVTYNYEILSPEYTFVWDSEKLVEFLDSLGKNSELSLKDLSQKTICLLAIT